MSSAPEQDSGDPLEEAGRAFEEHERELFNELIARAQRDIPEGATVSEAIAEMKRAIAEDDDARELLFRVTAIQMQNRGYIQTHFEEMTAKEVEPEPRYSAGHLSQEALDLMQRIGEEVERRLPPDLAEAEREARVAELLREDEELAALASRLERLMNQDGAPPPNEDPATGDT